MSVEIGERIKKRRKELGISQAELALQIGLADKSSISKFENSPYDLQISTLRKLAKALDCSVAYLLGEE